MAAPERRCSCPACLLLWEVFPHPPPGLQDSLPSEQSLLSPLETLSHPVPAKLILPVEGLPGQVNPTGRGASGLVQLPRGQLQEPEPGCVASRGQGGWGPAQALSELFWVF